MSQLEESATIASYIGVHTLAYTSAATSGPMAQVLLYGPKRVVVRKGHVGQSLYFVFSGAVSVVFDKEETSMFARPVEISVLRKGEVFGEIALLKNTTRNATIVCATDCELLAVDREEFYKYGLYDLFLKECQYRIDFLSNLDLFSSWPRSRIEELCYVSRIEPYSYNRVIIKDATKSEWIYFISKGCCELLRLVDLSKSPDFQQVIPASKRGLVHQNTVFLDMQTSAGYMRSLTEPERLLSSRPKTAGAASLPRLEVNGEEIDQEDEYDEKLKRVSTMMDLRLGELKRPGDKLHRAAWAVKAASTITNRKKILCRGTEPDIEFGRVGVGMFVKVDLLRPGQSFGLSNFYEPPRLFSMVSKGAEVIRVPKSKFRDLADDVTMEKIRRTLVRTYPEDENICRDFMRENTWNLFKQDLVEVLVTGSEKKVLKKSLPDVTPSVRAQTGRGRRELLRRCQTATGCERSQPTSSPQRGQTSSQQRCRTTSPQRCQTSSPQRRTSYHLASKMRQHTVTSWRPKTATARDWKSTDLGTGTRSMERPRTSHRT